MVRKMTKTMATVLYIIFLFLNISTSRFAAIIPSSITEIIKYLWFTVTSGVKDIQNVIIAGPKNARIKYLSTPFLIINANRITKGKNPSNLIIYSTTLNKLGFSTINPNINSADTGDASTKNADCKIDRPVAIRAVIKYSKRLDEKIAIKNKMEIRAIRPAPFQKAVAPAKIPANIANL